MKVDLNCDMGEGYGPWPMGDDEAMLDIVSSANIACGFHAGDPSIMFRMAEIAKRKGV
ncbi:MAG TPA: LamB/YcsF family protein, partial [Microvirga sp.]|nr:LamB/YcsF family protein [Microvirga sp.]